MKTLLPCLMLAAMLASCGTPEKKGEDEKVIGKPAVKLSSSLMQPETLWLIGRLGETAISPDGKQVAYTVTWYDLAENKGNTDIYIMDVNGENKRQLTKTAKGERNIQWRTDGKAIGFIRDGQLWEINADGTVERKVSDIEGGIGGFSYSPDMKNVLFAIDTKVDKFQARDIFPDLPKSEVYVYNDLMYRHWDSFAEGNYSHIYIANYDGQKLGTPIDIMPNEPYDAPMKPFGGMEEIAWSPDGGTVAYTCKKVAGKEYAMTTNSNIYLYTLATKETSKLTEGMVGYDKAPLFSPDGKKLFWLSMERPGFEADKERMFIYDFDSKAIEDFSVGFDSSPSSSQWSPDSKSIYFTACVDLTFRIFRLDMDTRKIAQLSKDGFFDYQQVGIVDANTLLAIRTDITRPAELYRVNLATGEGENISLVNKDLLDQLTLPTCEKRMVKTTDGKEMITWVILPPNFDSSKKHPALLICTGGPQGPTSQSYSYRWNYALMASQGYVVVYPGRRGVSGYGQAWTDAISRHHGEQEERDLLSAIDDVAKEPWVDKERLGAAGASFGGFSVFHLAGTHNKRFKAFFGHCGIFDFQSMYTTTEEMFFENWEKGGAPWDRETDREVARIYAQSPINFVKKWDTPIMVSHGMKDFRVPYTQGMAAFNTAQMLGIPSKLMLFPNENHWVLKPQNAVVWQREFFGWFDEYLKK